MAKYLLKIEAQQLRRNGHLLSEIAEKLEVPKSTVASWCREMTLSDESLTKLTKRGNDGRMKGRLMGAHMNRERREKNVREAIEWARRKVGSVNERDILLAGIGLYWGEGAKARKLNFTNSDPQVLIFIKKWLELLGVEETDLLIRVSINESHRTRYSRIETFWCDTLNLPSEQFYKPTFIKTKLQKVYENHETYYGVVSLRVRKSTDLQYKILGLIQAIHMPA